MAAAPDCRQNRYCFITSMNKAYITAIGTALPPYRTPQQDIANFMASMLEMDERERRQLRILYRASAIKYRYSVIEDYQLDQSDFTFYDQHGKQPPGVSRRMQLYRETAVKLASNAAIDCLKVNHTSAQNITHLITISCTGMYAPGLDIDLVQKLELPDSVHRTAVNFMGCYGAFNGLKLADAICRADNSARVLVVSAELCSIHFQQSKKPDDLLSGALFGDGAAAVLVEAAPAREGLSIALEQFHCTLVPRGQEDMTWNIGDFGFEMKLSAYVPNLIKGGIQDFVNKLLQKLPAPTPAIDYFAIHPGGKRILERIEEVLQIDREQNRFAWEVLREYGNLSSATVLFVLKNLLDSLTPADAGKQVLSMAFGPGLTMESAMLKIATPAT